MFKAQSLHHQARSDVREYEVRGRERTLGKDGRKASLRLLSGLIIFSAPYDLSPANAFLGSHMQELSSSLYFHF